MKQDLKSRKGKKLTPDEVSLFFNALDQTQKGYLSKVELRDALRLKGILPDDPRFLTLFKTLEETHYPDGIRPKDIEGHLSGSDHFIRASNHKSLIIPDFTEFCDDLLDIYEKTKLIKHGQVADYIPQLKRVDPRLYGLSVCTIDGQRFQTGDSKVPFCIQSSCKPVNYCLALDEHGEDYLHRFVGHEPSGQSFNELTLNHRGLPHNPMINSGAIMCCSLIRQDLDVADRFDFVLNIWRKLTGGLPVGFNNSVYLSERQTADRNFALGYFMREKGAFPKDTKLIKVLEFYFQCCSIEMSTDAMSVVAGALAGGGVCPLTGESILSPDTVKNCLSLMESCGMYDFSGEFAYSIGLPAKSGVSGVIMIVIPNVMGICLWSPRLDALGNSVRGVEFSRQLVSRFNFHKYDSLVPGQCTKKDPRISKHSGL